MAYADVSGQTLTPFTSNFPLPATTVVNNGAQIMNATTKVAVPNKSGGSPFPFPSVPINLGV